MNALHELVRLRNSSMKLATRRRRPRGAGDRSRGRLGRRPRAAGCAVGPRLPRRGAAGRRARRRPARADDARGEGRADDAGRPLLPQVAGRCGRVLPGVGAERRQLGDPGRLGRGLGGVHRRPAEARALDAPRHPAALRHGRGARAQQRARRGDLPPQHRPGLHAQPEAGRRGVAHHGRRDGGHRRPLELRAVRRGAAGRAVGPHVRGLRRVARAGRRSRRRRGARPPGRGRCRTRRTCSRR